MNRIAAAFLLTACLIAVACGGSQTPQAPVQPTSSPNVTIVATGSHTLGSASAKVTIVEFSDFQCPFCKTFYTDTEAQIISAYVNTGKAVFAFRHFPLTSIHQNAQIAAEASECAAQVGGNDAFWKYHDTLFANSQGSGAGLDAVSLKRYAADLHLDTTAFNSCLDTHATATIVASDLAAGAAANVQGTPTFFINGKALVGAQPFSAFQAAIDAAL